MRFGTGIVTMIERVEIYRMPRPGEKVEVFQLRRLLARGTVITVDAEIVSIADTRGLVDLDTYELRRGLRDGSVTICCY